MEILFDYGLVLLFFILVPIFVIGILSTHPYTEPPPAKTMQVSSVSSNSTESKIAYGVLALLLLSLFVIVALDERRAHAGAS